MALGCAAGFDASSLQEKFASNQKRWRMEADSTRNAAYLVHFDASGPKGKVSGSLEIYWLFGDTVILFSPGLFGKGSLRGRWVLGESLVVYFPREKSYYKGWWEDFLLGIKEKSAAQDSLIFAILSRRAFLAESGVNLPEKKDGGWTVQDRLGSWERRFMFNRRGRPSEVVWHLASPAAEAKAEMEKKTAGTPWPKRLEWDYFSQKAAANFDVERPVLNAAIPAAKRDFRIPAGTVRLERIEVDEER